jgi:hypothetical protein
MDVTHRAGDAISSGLIPGGESNGQNDAIRRLYCRVDHNRRVRRKARRKVHVMLGVTLRMFLTMLQCFQRGNRSPLSVVFG